MVDIDGSSNLKPSLQKMTPLAFTRSEPRMVSLSPGAWKHLRSVQETQDPLLAGTDSGHRVNHHRRVEGLTGPNNIFLRVCALLLQSKNENVGGKGEGRASKCTCMGSRLYEVAEWGERCCCQHVHLPDGFRLPCLSNARTRLRLFYIDDKIYAGV